METSRNQTQKALEDKELSMELLRMMPLKFRTGDCYSPHDLTPSEQRHYMAQMPGKLVEQKDEIEERGVNPLDLYRVCFFILFIFNPPDEMDVYNDTDTHVN